MTSVERWNNSYPFAGLGALGAADAAEATLTASVLAITKDTVEIVETWLPTALAAAVASGVSAEKIKAIYCKLAPAIALNPKIQAAFAAYAAGGCANNPNLPPLKKPVNWVLWVGVGVGALALIGGAIWYMKRRR